MGKLIIDAHSHLWLKQDTWVDGKRILSLKNGRSIFMDEEVQMMPPFIIDGQNTAEVFLSNMDYAQVGGAVVVQEVIDGNQNAYLTNVQQRYPDRFCCMGMAWTVDEAQRVIDAGLKGIAFPGHRLHEPLQTLMPVFKLMEQQGLICSMCLADDERQIAQMAEVIQECPELRVAIGHFGMANTASFKSQVLLARQGKHVMIESG
ncbi:MAG: amidohydrolase family protein, partial [Prevotella sp.]|nr:amidohydrolase family protein [Prevotella sp.]